ncbi:hypothetical protein M8C13_19220 [Crossiella sp. SN42]|uniref:hypothetical protein n=1 Tax=Crossiella sp. SN42 TaxID=2944808 RepID=UPI00207C173F|nr:hypothetical protein [Crossiella sp. SN42]MCO1577888.1 hypothetical protein [Crossiella sp. SN42]
MPNPREPYSPYLGEFPWSSAAQIDEDEGDSLTDAAEGIDLVDFIDLVAPAPEATGTGEAMSARLEQLLSRRDQGEGLERLARERSISGQDANHLPSALAQVPPVRDVIKTGVRPSRATAAGSLGDPAVHLARHQRRLLTGGHSGRPLSHNLLLV